MWRNIQIGILLLLAFAIAFCFLLDVAYFFKGSMELFPTAEQQDTISSITIGLGVFLVLVETVIVFLLWRLLRRRQKVSSPRSA